MIPPDSTVTIRDFNGLILAMAAEDLPAGAAERCVNACVVKIGELQVRGGLKPLTFDSEA